MNRKRKEKRIVSYGSHQVTIKDYVFDKKLISCRFPLQRILNGKVHYKEIDTIILN